MYRGVSDPFGSSPNGGDDTTDGRDGQVGNRRSRGPARQGRAGRPAPVSEPPQTPETLLQQFRASTALYHALFESSADPILVADRAGQYLDSNAAVSALLGYSKDELRRLPSGGLTTSANPQQTRREFARLQRQGTWQGQIDLRARDGTVIPVEAQVRAIDLPAGRVYLGTWRDPRARQLAEQERARLAAIVEASDDAIISETLDGIITSWNPGAQRLYGYRPPEVLGQPRSIIIPADRQDELATTLDRLRRGERIEHFETVRRRKDGRLIDVSISMSPLRDGSGAVVGASGIGRDITERRALERLQQEFIALVSHELRNPLTAIKVYAQLLLRRGAHDERVAQSIVERSDQLDRLISDLLESSHLQSGRLELRRRQVDLLDLVTASIERARVLTDRHQLRLTVSPPGLVGLWDPERLDQVLTNLFTNAIKYAPDGGEILVRVEQQGSNAAVAIQDHGIGIAPDQLPRLFDRFHRAAPATSATAGLGIGLYVARELITAHGGRIWAESPGPDQGATFQFTLPLAGSVEDAPVPGPAPVVDEDAPRASS